MSQAAALLASLTEDTSAYSSSEKHIVIGNDRFITVPESLKRLAVQYDHDVETVTFDCPRFWDEHDMSQMVIYINYLLPNGTTGQYKAKNVNASGQIMNFDWTISNNVTQYNGKLSFLVCIKKTDGNGHETNHWNSELNQDCYISEGLECTQTAVTKYPDIITQLLTRMDEVEEIATPEAMQAYTDTWLEENRESIVTEIGSDVRTKADAIICFTQGETISVSDSSDDYLRGLRVFGKSTQDGIPTPDAPADLVSVENPAITVASRNIAVFTDMSAHAHEGVTWSCENGAVTANGTAAAISSSGTFLSCNITGLVGTFRISGSSSTIGVFVAVDKAGTMAWYQERTFELDGTERNAVVYCQVGSGVTVNETVYPMLTLENENGPWENGKAHQSLTITRTLPGIPVSSGGNYIDSNGQQWICDEIDFERGVYAQRVVTKTYDGTENWYLHDTVGSLFILWVPDYAKNGMTYACLNTRYSYAPVELNPVDLGQRFNNNGANGANLYYIKDTSVSTVDAFKEKLAAWATAEEPMKIAYPLFTPIETPLTAEEIENFKQLHTNYPNTTVFNDSGAWMGLSYNADTKCYVDNHSVADEKIEQYVNSWLETHYANAEGVRF